ELVKGVGGAGSLSNVVAISAGVYDAMALLSDGTVVAWGYGDYGELGNGEGTESDVPVAVKGVGGSGTLSNVVAISAGGYDGLALLSDGSVDAWGYGDYGELGNGEYKQSDAPVQVKGVGGSGTLSGVSAISAGGYFNLALLSGGSVDAWGYGEDGELGNGIDGEIKKPKLDSLVPGGIFALTHGAYNYTSLVVQGATASLSGSSVA